MSRNEFEQLSPEEDKKILRDKGNSCLYFYSDGEHANEEIKGKKLCAKAVRNNDSGNIKYYVLLGGGHLYDPTLSNDVTYNRRYDFKLKLISHEAFKLYIRFLGVDGKNNRVNKDRRKKTLLHNAERLI